MAIGGNARWTTSLYLSPELRALGMRMTINGGIGQHQDEKEVFLLLFCGCLLPSATHA